MSNKNKTKSSNTSVTRTATRSNDENNKVDIEQSKYVYELVNGWIVNADNKVSVSCGIFTGVFGVITFLSEHYVSIPDNPSINEYWQCFYMMSLIFSLIVMIVAVFSYMSAIFPNLKSNSKNNEVKKYPIYFGDISSIEYKQYRKHMENGTVVDFNEELMHDSWFNSRICLRKMKRFRTGLFFSFVAIVLSLICFISHVLMYR
jgi:hypothetical protein